MKNTDERDTHAELPHAVILTAISCEFSSISNFLIDKSTKYLPSGTVYTEGFYQTNYGRLKLALFETGAGNIESTQKTLEVVQYLNPSLIIFSGVAGGLKDVKIGDVVASSKVSYFEAGKVDKDFLPRSKSSSVYPKVLDVAKYAARRTIPLGKFKDINNAPSVFVGPITSGEKVIANTKSPYFEQIKNNHSDALAVEMEGYGVLKVATENKKRISHLLMKLTSETAVTSFSGKLKILHEIGVLSLWTNQNSVTGDMMTNSLTRIQQLFTQNSRICSKKTRMKSSGTNGSIA